MFSTSSGMILKNTRRQICNDEIRIQKRRRKQVMIRNIPDLRSIDHLLSAKMEGPGK